MKKIITIDGPAASGKEKISKYVSRKWKYKHLDSGTLYRNLAFILLENGVNLKSTSEIKKVIFKLKKYHSTNTKSLELRELAE